jgi:formylglycine-generating enzyme required for sulfatase activity
MKSTLLLICLVASLCILAPTESNSDVQGKDATPSKPQASDSFVGKAAGQVRDDNGLKTKFVWCPSGKFMMGNPESENELISNDQVEVTLTTGFWLGKYEVTQSEWKQVMKTEPWKGLIGTKEGADFPAAFVSWNDSSDFCRKLTEQEREAGRLLVDWEYTLPTEAQWEYACRARTETSFSFGDDESKLGEYAWFQNNAGSADEKHAQRIGQKKANPWGIHDMHGNVWEWCRDVYSEERPGGRDPEVKADERAGASNRMCRGGSWISDAASCRSGDRVRGQPVSRLNSVGFRVALSPVRPDK